VHKNRWLGLKNGQTLKNVEKTKVFMKAGAHIIGKKHRRMEPIRSCDDGKSWKCWSFANAVMKRREICDVLLLRIFPMLVRFEITLPETRNSLQTQRYKIDDDVEEMLLHTC
jgi:hypothetical protein